MYAKKYLKLSLILTTGLGACPYTIHNDTNKIVFISNTTKGGYLLKPQKQLQIVAPESKKNAKYAHKPVSVFEKDSQENFNYVARIHEARCGKDSHVYISEIEQETPGDHTSGRFLIKRM